MHRVEDRLLVQEDASHGRAHFDYSHAAEDRAEQIGPRWRPPHSGTSGYSPYLATHPIVDGRIFIRGERGIYCYDLRAED